MTIAKTDTADQITAALHRILHNASEHVRAIDAMTASEAAIAGLGPGYSASQKAAKLLEVVATGGINNPLQQLVDPAWAVYAAADASAATTLLTPAGIGAFLAVVVPVALLALCGFCVLQCCARQLKKLRIRATTQPESVPLITLLSQPSEDSRRPMFLAASCHFGRRFYTTISSAAFHVYIWGRGKHE